ncbi:hypothetical protein EJ08DRAFT_704298, partial [Tothia fuscella]
QAPLYTAPFSYLSKSNNADFTSSTQSALLASTRSSSSSISSSYSNIFSSVAFKYSSSFCPFSIALFNGPTTHKSVWSFCLMNSVSVAILYLLTTFLRVFHCGAKSNLASKVSLFPFSPPSLGSFWASSPDLTSSSSLGAFSFGSAAASVPDMSICNLCVLASRLSCTRPGHNLSEVVQCG